VSTITSTQNLSGTGLATVTSLLIPLLSHIAHQSIRCISPQRASKTHNQRSCRVAAVRAHVVVTLVFFHGFYTISMFRRLTSYRGVSIEYAGKVGELTVLVGAMAEKPSRVLGGLLVLRFVV
jgi:hypothetical protein